MTPRLNVSLNDEDRRKLMNLRHLLEKRVDQSLTLSEVIREAISIAYYHEAKNN